MSHVNGIVLQVLDLDCLWEAGRECGCVPKIGQRTHQWYGSWMNDYAGPDAAYRNTEITPDRYGKCDHAIGVPGSHYEIGVYKNTKGPGYTLAFDSYGTGQVIVQKLGKGLEKLKQAYAVAVAVKAAKAKGWSVTRTALPNGQVKLAFAGRRW